MRLLRPTVLIFILLLSVSAGSAQETAPQTSSPEGLQLLHKMQTALGGADKIDAIQDYEDMVVAKTWTESGTPRGEVRKRTRWMKNPNLLRVDQLGPRDTYVLFFDGGSGSGWEMLPDRKADDQFKTTGEAIDLVGGELQFAKNYLSGFEFDLWLADRIPGYVVTSPAPNVVRIAHGGTATDVTLDATGLPIQSNSVSLADPDKPVPAETRMEGWTEVKGVRFPTKQSNYHNGVKLAETDQGDIRVNAGLTAQELSAKPADFAPVFGGR